jgi:hypothetical protein
LGRSTRCSGHDGGRGPRGLTHAPFHPDLASTRQSGSCFPITITHFYQHYRGKSIFRCKSKSGPFFWTCANARSKSGPFFWTCANARSKSGPPFWTCRKREVQVRSAILDLRTSEVQVRSVFLDLRSGKPDLD